MEEEKGLEGKVQEVKAEIIKVVPLSACLFPMMDPYTGERGGEYYGKERGAKLLAEALRIGNPIIVGLVTDCDVFASSVGWGDARMYGPELMPIYEQSNTEMVLVNNCAPHPEYIGRVFIPSYLAGNEQKGYEHMEGLIRLMHEKDYRGVYELIRPCIESHAPRLDLGRFDQIFQKYLKLLGK